MQTLIWECRSVANYQSPYRLTHPVANYQSGVVTVPGCGSASALACHDGTLFAGLASLDDRPFSMAPLASAKHENLLRHRVSTDFSNLTINIVSIYATGTENVYYIQGHWPISQVTDLIFEVTDPSYFLRLSNVQNENVSSFPNFCFIHYFLVHCWSDMLNVDSYI